MRRRLRALLAGPLAGAVLVAAPGAAVAAAGDFDPSFGTGGVATAPPNAALATTGANVLAIDGSDRIVTAGSVFDTPNSRYVFTVHRFLPSGAIDTSFGDQGLAVVPMTTGWSINVVTGVGVQPGGRIVVGARAYPTASSSDATYVVVGLTDSGDLDTGFDGDTGGNGILSLAVGPVLPPAGTEVARSLEVDDAGRILVSGVTFYTGPSMRATMARLNLDGTFDTTFAGDGKLDVPLPTSASDMKGFADLPGADGYALGGYTNPNTGPTVGQPSIIRVSETGGLVTGFTSSLSNTPGMSTTYWQGDPTKLGEINALAGLAGGALIAGGYQNLGQAALAKYTPTGGLDPAFGSGGVRLLQVGGGDSAVNDLELQPDGKILAAMSGTDSNHGFVARFTAAGALDPSFGTGGVVATDPTSLTQALARQGDGKVVAVARRGQPDTTLVRLLADPPPVASPPAPPTIQVTQPAGRSVKARKLKALAGTAGPAGHVSEVRLAVQRVDKRLLTQDHRCLWLKNHKGAFKKVRTTGKKCSDPFYRRAAGTSSWSYALTKRLPPGRYVLFALAQLDDGRTATVRLRFRLL